MGTDWSIHQPGGKLVKYINEEKANKELIVTQKEMERALKELAINIIMELNPPVTDEKLAKFLQVRKKQE